MDCLELISNHSLSIFFLSINSFPLFSISLLSVVIGKLFRGQCYESIYLHCLQAPWLNDRNASWLPTLQYQAYVPPGPHRQVGQKVLVAVQMCGNLKRSIFCLCKWWTTLGFFLKRREFHHISEFLTLVQNPNKQRNKLTRSHKSIFRSDLKGWV